MQEGKEEVAVRRTSVLRPCPVLSRWGTDLKQGPLYTEGTISVGTNLHFGIQTFIHFGVLFVNGHLYVIKKKEQCRLDGCLISVGHEVVF